MAKIGRQKKSEFARVDPQFLKEMKNLAKFRYIQNLEKKEPTTSEITNLAMRTDAWKQMQWELRTKPRKEDIK